MPTYGGNSIINGGEYNAWDSELHLRQKLNLGEDSVAQHTEDSLKGGDRFGFPELVGVMTNGAEPSLNWMIDEGGLKLRPILNRTGGHTAYRTHTCVEGVGRGYTDALRKIAEKRGASSSIADSWIWRRCRATSRRRSGPQAAGEIRALKGRSRVGDSPTSRCARLQPAHTADYNCTNHKGATGETMKFAQAIGADALQLAFIQLYPYAEPETGILDAPAVYPFRGPGYGIVYVDKKGKRFVNEMERRDVVSAAEIATGMKPTFTIFNEAMIPKMGTKEEVEVGMAKGRFVRGNSLAELASKIGIDPATPRTRSASNKYSPTEGPGLRSFTKAMSPPTARTTRSRSGPPHHTMGGLAHQPEGRVIDLGAT
jgi:fumarate reductase flavoprotein subunit